MEKVGKREAQIRDGNHATDRRNEPFIRCNIVRTILCEGSACTSEDVHPPGRREAEGVAKTELGGKLLTLISSPVTADVEETATDGDAGEETVTDLTGLTLLPSLEVVTGAKVGMHPLEGNVFFREGPPGK